MSEPAKPSEDDEEAKSNALLDSMRGLGSLIETARDPEASEGERETAAEVANDWLDRNR